MPGVRPPKAPPHPNHFAANSTGATTRLCFSTPPFPSGHHLSSSERRNKWRSEKYYILSVARARHSIMTIMIIYEMAINTAVKLWRAACAAETWCHSGSVGFTLWNCFANDMHNGLLIQSLTGSVKSMFASFFCFVFFLELQSSSCLSPLNTLVKMMMMMMSDRDFYILPQLASYPRSPSAFAIGRKLDTCPSFCTQHPPPPPPPPHPLVCRHACLLPPMSQPGTITLALWFFSTSHHTDHTTTLVQMTETMTYWITRLTESGVHGLQINKNSVDGVH